MSFGWAGQILRVDLSNMESSIEPVEPYIQSFIGGRGINVKMIYDEVGPQLSPFDPANKLAFGPGVLTGTPAPASGRLTVTGLAAGGFLRHSGIGGGIPAAIKWAGYDLIVIQGKADKAVYLRIQDNSVELKDAGHIWGKDIYETQQIIKDELGESFEVMCIGQGGENAVGFASIHTGWGSAAGRGGFGGIMGSKNLKAIAVKGSRGVRIAKVDEFLKETEEMRKSYAADKEGIRIIQTDGDRWVAWGFEQSGMGARGNFEACDWSELHFTKMDDFAAKYAVGPHGCASCPVSHYLVYDVPGIGRGGAKCIGAFCVTGTAWNADWKVGFHIYNLCNRYGLDICSTMNIVAFLTELYDKGIITARDLDGIVMKRGDEKAIIAVIHKIGKQEGFGQLFKQGVIQGARKLGRDAEEYAMAVKELELQPYEYRAFKQFGLAAATNTTDLIDAINILTFNWADAKDRATKERFEKEAEVLYGTREAVLPASYQAAPTVTDEGKCAALSMVGMCYLFPRHLAPYYGVHAKLFSLATGVEMSEADLLFAGQRVVTLERAFNVIRGMRRKDDTLPKRFFKEPVPDGPYKGEGLLKTKFDKALDDYYTLRGYDKDGIPKKETFEKYGLISEWQVFKKRVPNIVTKTSKEQEV